MVIQRLISNGHPRREVFGYSLREVRAYLQAIAQEEARRDRDRLALLRAALSGPQAALEVMEALDAIIRQ